MAPDPLLTVQEAAEFFRVSPQTVRRWTRAGRLSAVKTPSGRRRYRQSELEELEQDGGGEAA